MVDEWFKDRKNENAATKSSLELFKKAGPDKIKLVGIFLNKYKISYRKEKAILKIATANNFSYEIGRIVAMISNAVMQISGLNQNEQADRVGTLLGSFLAFIQYGLSSEKFRLIENKINTVYNPADIGLFAHYLKGIDHSAGYFISNRIKKIVQRRAKYLSETQKKLLVEIATKFD